MMYFRFIAALALTLGATTFSANASDTYWAYDYKGIEVTATGGADHAKEIAHNLRRLDLAVSGALSLEPHGSRPRTAVYVVPKSTFERFYRKSGVAYSSMYMSSEFDNTILIDASANGGAPFFDAYFGYTGSILSSAYSFRFPLWYTHGISQVFGASTIERKQVIIGGFVAGRVQPMLDAGWIPLKTLFKIRAGDPELSTPSYLARYEAECWFVVHQILMEKKYPDNFQQYFTRMDSGEDEQRAFAASFTIDQESLDKELHAAMTRGIVSIMKVQVADEPDSAAPTRLSESAAKGRLADLAARHAPVEVALQMTNDALASDPQNEDALAAAVRVPLRQRDLAAALAATGRLCALDHLSQKGTAQCAEFYARLLYEGVGKNPALATDTKSLADRSRKYFDTSITLDPENLASWNGMAQLLTYTHDVENATAFLPRAKHAWAMHSRNDRLARAVSGLCAMTGDYDTAIKFATVWQNNARTAASAAEADAALSRLQALAARSSIEATAGAPGAAAPAAASKP